jgi:superfamily II DNA helicase RecQ
MNDPTYRKWGTVFRPRQLLPIFLLISKLTTKVHYLTARWNQKTRDQIIAQLNHKKIEFLLAFYTVHVSDCFAYLLVCKAPQRDL